MKYYNSSQASRELGISSQEIAKMIRQKEIFAERRSGGAYRIPFSEIQRLARKLEKEEAELDKEFGEPTKIPQKKDINYLTVREVSEKLGIQKAKIKRLIKTGKIFAVKGASRTSPYLIAQTQLETISYMAAGKRGESPYGSVSDSPEIRSEQNYTFAADKFHTDWAEIQKNLNETMRYISSTQQQIALILRELMKKI